MRKIKLKRSTRVKAVLLAISAAVMAGHVNCSKVAVSNISPTDPSQDAANLIDNNDGTFDYESSVKVGPKLASELDIVWVIDNSGSMAAEIAHVRANLDRFTQTVSNQSNLKMALISKAGSGERDFNLTYPDTTRFMQINQEISSYDSLFQIGAGICPNNQGACSGFQNPAVQGKLRSFMRANSKKAFVIVTDDQSAVAPGTFKAMFNQQYAGQNFTLFGFVGLGPAASPCQAETGSHYSQLAKDTSGDVYNICDRDWSQTFSTLATSILTLVGPPPIPLPHKLSDIEILSVSLDGQPLEPSRYQVTDEGVVLAKEYLQAEQTYRVKIHFKMK